MKFKKSCELRELPPPHHCSASNDFLNFIGCAPGPASAGGDDGNGGGSGGGGGGGGDDTDCPLVTQMALLLYLGEYVHARHLWRRHRRNSFGGDGPANANAGGGGGGTSDNEHSQLRRLWEVARHAQLWNDGGVNDFVGSMSSGGRSSGGNDDVAVGGNAGSAGRSVVFRVIFLMMDAVVGAIYFLGGRVHSMCAFPARLRG